MVEGEESEDFCFTVKQEKEVNGRIDGIDVASGIFLVELFSFHYLPLDFFVLHLFCPIYFCRGELGHFRDFS